MGSLFVGLGLNAQGFLTGIDRASAKLSGFAGGLLGAINPLNALIGGALSGAGFVALIKGSMDSIVATRRLANQLGIDVEAMSALQYAAKRAGLNVDDMATGLFHLQRALGEARTGSEEAINKFRGLGLSANDLAKMSLDLALGKVADALNKLPTAADKAKAIQDIFGRGGRGLVGLLSQGSEGIKKFMDEAKKLGLTFTAFDADKVKAAKLAFDQMGESIRAVGIRLAIDIAPLVEAVAKSFTSTGTEGSRAMQNAFGGVGDLTGSLGGLADVIQFIGRVWETFILGLQSSIDVIILGFASGLQNLLEIAAKLPSSLGGDTFKNALEQVNSQITDSTESLRKNGNAIKDIWNGEWWSEAAKKAKALAAAAAAAAEESRKLTAAVVGLEEKMKDQIATWGLTSRQVEIYKLAKMGAKDADIDALKALDAQLTAIEKWDKAMKEGQAVMESLLTPQEKMETQIDKLNKLFQAGAITAEFYERGLMGAFDAAGKLADVKMPEAITKGSAGAFSAVARFEANAGNKADVNERIAKLLDEQKQLQVQGVQLQGRVVDVLEGNKQGVFGGEVDLG